MRAPSKRSPWRRDFSSVALESRRVGRYVLQMVSGSPEVLHRLQDSDFLGALWVQCLPLLDFEAACDALGLLPDGAVEMLNEAAFSLAGEPLLEGEDPLYMNDYVRDQLAQTLSDQKKLRL